ncbi:2-polyprenyl-6-methoxyphenol hydroxylase-like FAD-dependent oxidoreductase [Allocatelliglobosispora scoriae]|uniref:2-polyprenyl-6-methoxyphenol hydroxylase-like FAD-dependent oxidoreductase n=1 Tax=Allocatelliglobosispora scoriae TaxID=643052 RepID=A0A841C3K2_9ACTN|nr:FAD-dependent monooxygenase [Allocatelliglobosispora scoriae]MBB5874348.1 2-polyprenyl-6-methoxyphenol hydroxylase-like FAD-dependent oxidoreductase [Allocatelliglobosispora scoriae]
MARRTVLISGASIAGPTLAFWLHRAGLRVIVVERAPQLRGGGQTVDVRGAGREVARLMGIEDAVRAASTGEIGIQFVDATGAVKAAFGAEAFGGEGPVADLEILRGELARILHERTRDDVEYIFGDEITAIDDTGDRVRVGFKHGAARDVDLVIAADGKRSSTRDLVLADAKRVTPLGLSMGYFTIPRADTDTRWARWHNLPGGRSVMLRPDNLGTTRVLMSFMSAPDGQEHLDPAAQRDLLRRVYRDGGWEVPRALRHLDGSPDFYFESIAQIRMDRWSSGRVAVVGDAAYCASPISGMGTSLALVGAYVLAGELGRQPSHEQAFADYEQIMRPYAAKAQKLPPGTPGVANPRTAFGISCLNTVLRLASTRPVARLLRPMLAPPAGDFALPRYS